MSLPNDLSNIGSIANGIVNSITANSTAITTIIANGSFGTANQVLSSNGTSLYWGDAAAGSTFVRQTFTANSTVNTTFTITNGYTVNAIDVYENGIKLIVGTEVTANNGTSITLATSALDGSTVDVVGLLSASIYSLNVNTVSQGFPFSWTNNHVFNALVDFSTGSNIASAATINLNTATSNRVHITGTTAITAVTLTRGPRTVIFDGVLTLTHNATTNNLPGAANITTAAGDRAIYESDGTTVYCVSYTRASGTAVAPSGGITTTETITGNTTLTAASAGYQYIATTVLGRSITLPDATTVVIGSPKFYLDNTSGGYPVGIRNSAGTLLMGIAAGGAATVSCQSISSAAGVWSITGRNLEPGLITIDNTFSSTYLDTVLKPFVALDSNKSIHFLTLSSGFAAVAVDNTTGAVGTPVTVSATASATPRTAFMITSTTAIVFYSSTTGTLISVVISLSGATTLTVGTASSTLTAAGAGVEDFIGAPKIAQLSSTLYLVSYATATGAGTTSVAAFQVSGGTTVTLGSAVNIIAVNNVINSTTTYALTATTGFVIYLSGAVPHPINAVVVSVTNANPPVCTVGIPEGIGTRADTTAPASCLLSSTKALITPDTNNTIVGAQAITISGTSVSVGAVLTVETIANYSGALRYVGESTRTRYNPVLFPLTATTALFSYIDSTARTSRAVILTESSGTMTKGTILFNSISSGTLPRIGMIVPQGTTEFIAMKNTGSSTDNTLNLLANSHKISGTSITSGLSTGALSEAGVTASIGSGDTLMIRLTTGVYVIGIGTGTGNAGPLALCVMKSSGDAIDYRGAIRMPDIRQANFSKKLDVSSNRIVILAVAQASTIADVNGLQIRLLNIEIAS